MRTKSEVVLLAAVLWGCGFLHAPSRAPFVVPSFKYPPPEQYYEWFAEAHSCALYLKRVLGDTARFTVDSAPVVLANVTWITVPTERRDGSFPGFMEGRDTAFVWGMTSLTGDTVWLPAPVIHMKYFLKHEAMHIFVHSPTERQKQHGLPWGFCEFM